MTGGLIGRGDGRACEEQTRREGVHRVTGRNRSNVSTNHKGKGLPASHKKPGRGKKGSTLQATGGAQPADPVTADFQTLLLFLEGTWLGPSLCRAGDENSTEHMVPPISTPVQKTPFSQHMSLTGPAPGCVSMRTGHGAHSTPKMFPIAQMFSLM